MTDFVWQIRKDEFGENIVKFFSDTVWSVVPENKSNIDYQEYLEWLAEGNEPEVIDG